MRTLNRNKKTLYYALYNGVTPFIDENGDRSGEYAASYLPPVKARMNIAPARNDAESDPFGISEPYTHVMVTANTKCPIDESTVIWIGSVPEVEAEEGMYGQLVDGQMVWHSADGAEVATTDAYNYVVVRKAESINSITYAIRKVMLDAE